VDHSQEYTVYVPSRPMGVEPHRTFLNVNDELTLDGGTILEPVVLLSVELQFRF
jgi:hypothetical protein